MSASADDFSGNLQRFSGFADTYDAHRPAPPSVLLQLLPRLAGMERPRLVVDIGSGTGLSTLFWAGHADGVIGIEPNDDMRAQAQRRALATPNADRIDFRHGLSHATGLPDAAADIVTISQALHWMDPAPTFAEVGRVLRPGGVFAAFDCDWPPAVHWEADAAYEAAMERVHSLEGERRTSQNVRSWSKGEHLQRMRASRQFRYTRETVAHHIEQGDVDRLTGILRSQGGAAALLRAGVSETELGLDELRRVAERVIGSTTVPWFWSYRVRVGIK